MKKLIIRQYASLGLACWASIGIGEWAAAQAIPPSGSPGPAGVGNAAQAVAPAARVVSLPPPPVNNASVASSAKISTPAHVPLPPRSSSGASATGESLIEGMEELIGPSQAASALGAGGLSGAGAPPLPPLPKATVPNGNPDNAFNPNTFDPSLGTAPPLPSSAALPSMPRMTSPDFAADATNRFTSNQAAAPVSNTLVSRMVSPVDTPAFAPPTNFVTPVNMAGATQSDNVVAEDFPAGRLIAVVGTEHVLAGDMAVFVEPIIEQNRDKIPTGDEEKKIRSQLTRQALRQYVEIKAIYQEFFRDMVGTTPPKELAETKKMVTTKAGKIFFEKQVPVLMEKYKATTIAELEKKLQEKSLSLTTLRGQFIEQVLASELERKFVPDKFEVDRHDLINAYRDPANRQRWQVAGRVRWQQLTVRFDKHPTRQEAEAQIREMGNEVFLGGKPFESVAKQSSEGYTASEGGNYDWTTQGSLKSTELDQALFEIAPNSLSQIIADDIGLHIVRVLEREPGHEQDFTEAQVELREELSEERRTKEVREFRKRITDRTTVWTLWPEDIPGSRPLVEALGTTEPTL